VTLRNALHHFLRGNIALLSCSCTAHHECVYEQHRYYFFTVGVRSSRCFALQFFIERRRLVRLARIPKVKKCWDRSFAGVVVLSLLFLVLVSRVEAHVGTRGAV
jgi:hypothetical protein